MVWWQEVQSLVHAERAVEQQLSGGSARDEPMTQAASSMLHELRRFCLAQQQAWLATAGGQPCMHFDMHATLK